VSIGYIGLGNMGGALARRLQLKRKLFVYDLNDGAVQRMVANGSVACSTLTEVASHCEVIFLCLPTSEHVRAAVLGESGLAAAVKPGTLIIDQTTGDPVATRAMAQELRKRDVELVDAPVSGGALGAQAGTIAIMVGATPEQYARVHPILTLISANVIHAGDVGAGQVIKLVNNMLSGAQRLLTLEAMTLAVKNGIDAHKACEILVAGGARNAFIEKFLPSILEGKLVTGFTLGLMHKDIQLACQLGNDSGVPLAFGNLARELYLMCIREMGPDAEVHAAAFVIERLAGTHLVPPGFQPA
jgi:3-hydroxyisobutyrate dehydrogenase